MGVTDDARATQDSGIRRSDVAANKALRMWRRMEPTALDESWDTVGPRITDTVSAAASKNVAAQGRLVDSVARADGMRGDRLVPAAFTGVDGSGRDLGSFLYGAVTTTKQAIGAGASIADAMAAGGSYLTVMLKTAIADVERSGSAAAAAGKGYTTYLRLVNPGACSRCAILAGSDRFRSDFRRHPACRCSTIPVRNGEVPDGMYATPEEYFQSLSEGEQNRVFTKAGAESIRLGADPIKVVDSRRGMNRVNRQKLTSSGRLQRSLIGRNPDGTPVYGYVTFEGVTRRGAFGRAQERLGSTVRRTGRYAQVDRPRLMPESILEITDDVEMRRVLLRDAGYLKPVIRDTSTNDWIRERAEQEARDRVTADAFYRSKGIFTG